MFRLDTLDLNTLPSISSLIFLFFTILRFQRVAPDDYSDKNSSRWVSNRTRLERDPTG